LGVGVLDVVQVLHGFPKGTEHLPAMGTDLGVTDDGSGAGQVPKGREEPLGPGVDDQQPAERTGDTSTHTHPPLAVPAAVSPSELDLSVLAFLLELVEAHPRALPSVVTSQVLCGSAGSRDQTGSLFSAEFCFGSHP
uniref:Uncharacterized protein n=1 Tax=Anas zonorhyncha TaxID=75864 RepID=A0A8B9VCY6_9AVES